MLRMARKTRGDLCLPAADGASKLEIRLNDQIKAAYETYRANQVPCAATPSLPTLELLTSSDLRVNVTRELGSRDIIDVDVAKVSDSTAINFMGYDRGLKCLAFKGEARLFDTFLDFTAAAGNGGGIAGAFKGRSEVRLPPLGLERGLSFEEFKGRVEIVEYVMWMYGAVEDNQSKLLMHQVEL